MAKQPVKKTAEERSRIPLPTLQEDFGGSKKNYHLVSLPEEVTEELAEDVGIHISDGSMRINGTNSRIQYSGHTIDDFPYYIFRFIPLLKRLWGTNRIYCEGLNDKQTILINIYSKHLVSFKHEVLELPYGKKEKILIPKYFLRSSYISYVVLRGLFDGDGSISFKSKWGLGHTYPVISYSSISKPLIKQIFSLLDFLGFTLPDKLQDKNEGTTFVLSLNGDKNYERWMNTIGFNNPKHLTKVILYERFGIVPPKTDLVERVKLIRGEIELSSFYQKNKLKVNQNRVIEKKVLQHLLNGASYISELGRVYKLHRHRIRNALRRLSTRELVECIQARKGGKSIYRITQWGINKLKRPEALVKRMRNEFHLAV